MSAELGARFRELANRTKTVDAVLRETLLELASMVDPPEPEVLPMPEQEEMTNPFTLVSGGDTGTSSP